MARLVFGLLLLANLIVLLWGYRHQAPLEPETWPLPPGVPALELTRGE